nr:unnamed protein product [Spirometra erinaceieuropaei]
MARFGDQWVRLADSPTDHTYFCQSVGEHLLKTARYPELINLLTNLKFNCACLLILGPSAVVAEFRRYRPIFEAMGRISDWHTYLRFLQTTAYQLINPDSSVRALHIRARSPTRPGSLADVTCGKDFLLAGCIGLQRRSMTPDDGATSGLDLSTAPASLVGGSVKHRSPSAFRSPTRKDELDRRVVSPKRVGMSKNLMIKGLDLVQLGLTLPHDNAIFQQSVNIISSSNSKDHRTPKYYWFCSNISTSGTELLWATRTGTATITAIAAELDYTFLPPTLRRRMRPSEDRSINRQLVGTSDGRIIILDATSGYEVAVHQVHKPSVEVKTICLLPGGQACLSCGSDGSMIVSTLPPLDPSPKSPTTPRNRSDDCANKRSPGDQFFDTIDVDEVEDSLSEESELYDAPNSPDCDYAPSAEHWFGPDSTSPFHSATDHYTTADAPSPSHPSDSPSPYHQHRSTSPVLQEAEFPTYTTAPTVLADLPALVEICRLSDASPRKVTDTSGPDAPTQMCIALSPMGTCMLFADCSPTSSNDAPSKEGPKDGKTLFGVEDKEKSNGDTDLNLTLSMYSLLTGSPAPTKASNTPSKFALVKCRDLILPSQIPPKDLVTPFLPCVLSAVISSDDSMIGCGLSNGRLWIYSLDEVGWVACISTAISAKADPFTAAPISTRTPRPRTETSPFQQATDSELADLAFADGPIVNACAFLSWPYESRAVVSSSPWIPPSTPLCAAAVGGFICVWSFQNKLPASQSDLQTTTALLASSRCQFRLRCPLGSFAHSLDTHCIGSRCLLAAGMTNGRVMVYSFFPPKTTCDGVLFGICPLLRTLPAWFRFAQCLRRYQDLVLKEPMPHLYNAAKYATTFLTAVFSTWAELNPSGVPVRRQLQTTLESTKASRVIAPHPPRRVIWNFFRLENEHLNNCGNFRAVRDIFVTPIRKSMFVAMNKDSTHSNAATLLRNGHTHKKQHNRSHYDVLDDEVGDVETLRTDDVPVESTPKAPKGYGEYATMATGATTTTTTVNSKSLWHFFRDLYLKNRNERRRKQGIEVISNMESALRAANVEDNVKHPTPYTPRAILRTDVSPLHEHANEDDSQADDHAERTESRSRDDYFTDWDYEPPDRAKGGYSSPSFSAFSQDTSNHNAAAAATTDVIKTDDVSCRQTLEAIVNPLPPPAVSDRRHRTVHYDQREVVLDGTPRRASVQATIPLHVCILEPNGPAWELRTDDSETGEGSAVATGPSSSSGGASMFSSTRPGILVPHNSPTTATGSGRPSDRGWNLILDPTYLPLPDEVSDDSPDTTAIPMKTQHLARQLRSILRNFADQKKQQQLQSQEDISWHPIYRKHGEQQHQQQQLENPPPEESCRSVSCATRDTFLLDVDDCADAGVVEAGQQQKDSGEPEEKREDRALQARSSWRTSWGARPSGYQMMPSLGIEEQRPITRRRQPSSTASKDSLFSRSEEGHLFRPQGRSPLGLEVPSATSKSEPSTSTSSVAISAPSPADGRMQTELARSRQSSGLSPHAPPVPSRFTVATVPDTSVTPTPVIKSKKTV